MPDLTVEITGWTVGQRGNVQALVSNIGHAAAAPSRIDLTIAPPPHGVHFEQLGEIGPGEQLFLQINGTIEPGATLTVTVDSHNEMREEDEQNNFATVRVPPEEQPELPEVFEPEPEEPLLEEPADPPVDEEELDEPPATEFADLTVEVRDVRAGESGAVSVLVRNEGSAPSPRNRVRLERDGERNIDARVPALEPGADTEIELRGSLDDGAGFLVTVDPEDQVEEADEDNNAAVGRAPQAEPQPPADPVQPDEPEVGPVEPDQPEVECACGAETTDADLVVTISEVTPGNPLQIRARVQNIGTEASDPADVTLTVTSGVVQQFVAKAPALGPDDTADLAFFVPLHDPTIEAFVDSGFAVPESNEDNNKSNAVTAPAKPDIVAGPPVAMLNLMPVALATGLTNGREQIAGREPGDPPRKVGVFRYPEGGELVFVEDELVIAAELSQATDLADRYGGEIVLVIDPYADGKLPTFVIRVDPMTASFDPPEPDSGEPGLVSSDRALRLLSIISNEQRDGRPASMNLVLTDDDAFDGNIFEGRAYDPSAPDAVTINSALLSYIQAEGVFDVNVIGAWQALEIAGRPQNSVPMTLVDGGFFDSGDLPPQIAPTPSPNGLWPIDTSLSDVSFLTDHGTKVALAAAAVYGNGVGSAGPGGRAVRLDLRETALDAADDIASIVGAALSGARIISLSRSADVPHDTGAFFYEYPPIVTEFESLTIWLRQQGILFFSSAGNDGFSVDSTYSDGQEKFWVSPCENQGTICVGGWADDKLEPDDSSNHGDGTGESVDISGPFTMLLGPHLDYYPDDIADWVSGTSFATPFVAGVAAMVWQAKPDLSADQVWGLLEKYARPGEGMRAVNAYGPVREALMMSGESFAPMVRMVLPTSPITIAPGQDVVFGASAVDVEDGPECCTLTWTSDIDGDLGSGAQIVKNFQGQPLGPRTITVTATDSSGAKGSASLVVDLQNPTPVLKVLAPKPHEELTTGLPYAWKASLSDNSGPLVTLLTDCTGLTWTDMETGEVLGEGCDIEVTFSTAGKRYVIVSYTDDYGAVASRWFAVNVTDTPANDMSVTLTEPGVGDAYYSTEQIPLAYEFIDPAGGPNANYVVYWQLGRNKSSLKSFTPTVQNGQMSIAIADVFPNETSSTQPGTFLIDLLIIDPSRPGVGATAQRTISFLPEIR